MRRGDVAMAHGAEKLADIADIRPSMASGLRSLQARLQRTTQRERLLLGGLILGAFLYAPIAALEWRDAQRDRYVEAMTERSAARLSQAASRRITATAPAEAALEDMKTWGFDASNLAIAQLLMEQKLVEAADKAGLANVKITPDAEITTIGPNQWLGAEIQADLRWTPVFAFLDALTVWPEGFTVRQFRYDIVSQPNFAAANGAEGSLGRAVIAVAVPVRITNPELEPAT